jgi:hypothetical protein
VVTEEILRKLLDAEAKRGRTADDLVVILAHRGSEMGRALNAHMRRPALEMSLFAVPLEGFEMEDAGIVEAVSSPPPLGMIRLLEFNAQDLWRLTYAQLPPPVS